MVLLYNAMPENGRILTKAVPFTAISCLSLEFGDAQHHQSFRFLCHSSLIISDFGMKRPRSRVFHPRGLEAADGTFILFILQSSFIDIRRMFSEEVDLTDRCWSASTSTA